jgi:TfoX/Sxy family transcriptional regulator of competence genes
MASQQSIVDYIVEQTRSASVTARKMFGEYGLYSGGKMVALVCDDALYVKPTPAGRAFVGAACEEGQPYPNAKPHVLIPAERWDDGEWLAQLFALTASELPVPQKKRKKSAGG